MIEFVLPLRFWKKTKRGKLHSLELGWCLEWTGAVTPRGYGNFNLSNQTPWITKLTHRLVYMEAYGEVPTDLEISHLCDNPPCIRLGHLVAETHEENMRRKPAPEVCRHGHSDYYTFPNGRRNCRTCAKINRSKYPKYRTKVGE